MQESTKKTPAPSLRMYVRTDELKRAKEKITKKTFRIYPNLRFGVKYQLMETGQVGDPLNFISDTTERMRAKAEYEADQAREKIHAGQLISFSELNSLQFSCARKFRSTSTPFPLINTRQPMRKANQVNLIDLTEGEIVEVVGKAHLSASNWIIEKTDTRNITIWHDDEHWPAPACLYGSADSIFTFSHQDNGFLVQPGLLRLNSGATFPYFLGPGLSVESSWSDEIKELKIGLELSAARRHRS